MSLPPQEPPRGPPSLNVSQKSHKVNKQQPPRPSAGASQSHHPRAPPRAGNMSRRAALQRRAQPQPWIPPFIQQVRIRMMIEQEQREQRQQQQQQQRQRWIASLNELPVNFPLAPTAPPTHFFPAGASSFLQNPPPPLQFNPPPPPLQFNPAAAASSNWPYHPPQDYFPPTPAAAESSSMQNPPPGFYPVTASHSLPGPSQSFPTAARDSIPDPSWSIIQNPPEYHHATPGSSIIQNPPEYHHTTQGNPPHTERQRILRSAPVDPAPAASHSILQGPPSNFHPAASGSLPYIPTPAVAGGSSIWYDPTGYFPDNSSSSLPIMPVNSPAAGSSSFSYFPRPPEISPTAAPRSSLPSASSEYSPSASSSAANLPLEFSLTEELVSYYSKVDSTKPPPPPPSNPSG